MSVSAKKSLVLMVEGEADAAALPVLVKRILTERGAWEVLRLDDNVFRIGGVEGVTGHPTNQKRWENRLKAVMLRPNTAAILAFWDGDQSHIEGAPFCPASVAKTLASRSRSVGGGTCFSLGCVFARQEFESWLIAGIDSVSGKQLLDGRPGVKANVSSAALNVEVAPRDAKGWLSENMVAGYRETQDQPLLTKMLDWESVRAKNLRSFRRLESAIDQLTNAVRTGVHVVTPS